MCSSRQLFLSRFSRVFSQLIQLNSIENKFLAGTYFAGKIAIMRNEVTVSTLVDFSIGRRSNTSTHTHTQRTPAECEWIFGGKLSLLLLLFCFFSFDCNI